jgi:hypothetical protein
MKDAKNNELNVGDVVKLIEMPTGHDSKHYPLTIGNLYTIKAFDGSNIITNTDDPKWHLCSYNRERVEKAYSKQQIDTILKTLDPYEIWMVNSNLQTIHNGTPKEKIIATLKANGYSNIANAVQTLTNG